MRVKFGGVNLVKEGNQSEVIPQEVVTKEAVPGAAAETTREHHDDLKCSNPWGVKRPMGFPQGEGRHAYA